MATATPLLGVMEFETEPASWGHLGDLAETYLQDAGGFAAIGLLLWALYVLLSPAPAVAGSRRRLISRFMAVTGVAALVVYLVAFGLTLAVRAEQQQKFEEAGLTAEQQEQIKKQELAQGKQQADTPLQKWQNRALAAAGLLALLALCEPFVLDFARLRWRRIYAIAKVSFKEAVRRRIVWIFFAFLLVFIFPSSWFASRNAKPEDALRSHINVITFWMTFLLIATALLLSGFSIPTDVKNQTIHTVVTKPVERFEVVAGRFLGYTALVTIALVAYTAVSLSLIELSNVNPAAREESMKARVPVYGGLELARERPDDRTLQPFAGIDVGREYAYRRHIAGGSPHRAVWNFTSAGDLRALRDQSAVPLEFAFDIYRSTKGRENQGIDCSFDLLTWKWDPASQRDYEREVRDAFGAYPAQATPDDSARWERMNAIAEKYGRFERRNVAVSNFHTYSLPVPPGLIRNALAGEPSKDAPLKSARGPALLQVRLKCESLSQFIGVAPYDLYFLEAPGTFWANFFKAEIGLWCRLVIVIGIAVAASTYFAGVISFLLALSLFLGGYFLDFIRSLASGTNIGGGPFESFNRLVKGQTTGAELDKTPTTQIALFGDDAFRWMIRRIVNIIPDTEQFTWSNYLAQGFSVPLDFIALNLVILAAYLLPWALLAYYLMRSREVAA
jgi:hypothetical protein